jgi:hypothetical protein
MQLVVFLTQPEIAEILRAKRRTENLASDFVLDKFHFTVSATSAVMMKGNYTQCDQLRRFIPVANSSVYVVQRHHTTKMGQVTFFLY